jgi:hypothetical protein
VDNEISKDSFGLNRGEYNLNQRYDVENLVGLMNQLSEEIGLLEKDGLPALDFNAMDN